MNAIFLIIPVILIRYAVPIFFGNPIYARVQFFPPVEGAEKIMLNVYKVTTIVLLLSLFLFDITLQSFVNYVGVVLYVLGAVFYLKSLIDFARADEGEVINIGLYKFSRNPMYVAFFIYFLGITLMINSYLYFNLLIVFQISVHIIILGEEKWCRRKYGEEYENYTQEVRRYL